MSINHERLFYEGKLPHAFYICPACKGTRFEIYLGPKAMCVGCNAIYAIADLQDDSFLAGYLMDLKCDCGNGWFELTVWRRPDPETLEPIWSLRAKCTNGDCKKEHEYVDDYNIGGSTPKPIKILVKPRPS
jgi:hypothetical protein